MNEHDKHLTVDLPDQPTRRRDRQNQSDSKKNRPPKKGLTKSKFTILIAIIFVATVGAVALALVLIDKSSESASDSSDDVSSSSDAGSEPEPVEFYSNLTGEVIAKSGLQASGLSLTVEEAKLLAEEKNKDPLLCIQIPNGNDGARPQAGLNEAKIIFEAIAEAGITRFAAIFQNPTGSAIGPIRSLRTYYLEWDTPFDCTVVHAGGEQHALEQVAQGYRHLSESTTYMWRTTGYYKGSEYIGYARPNNLFSDATRLNRYNSDNNYTSSDPKVWPRLTPAESEKQRESSELASATSIKIHYSNSGNYNPIYTYDAATNKYLRSYENGTKHLYYICENKDQPKPQEDCGEAVQVAADVAIVMKVKEQLDPVTNYRESIETTGSGEAYVFQNGKVIEGTWTKKSKADQIVFADKSGAVISLAPGQTWISAIPTSYGKLTYE